MKLQKMSLANIQGKLSRTEMKKIMAGSGNSVCTDDECTYYESGTGMVIGTCEDNSNKQCVCNAGTSSVVWDACNGESGG